MIDKTSIVSNHANMIFTVISLPCFHFRCKQQVKKENSTGNCKLKFNHVTVVTKFTQAYLFSIAE